jgi:hypothetical protein
MSIQDWAALAEIVSSAAVVASLVYLAVQIRQNTKQLAMHQKSNELAAFERNVASGNRVREMFVLNPEVSELFLLGGRSYTELERGEKLRFGMLLSNMFSELQGAYVRQMTYANDPADFEGSKRILDSILAIAGVREWLAENEPDWRPEFEQLVKQRVDGFLARKNA